MERVGALVSDPYRFAAAARPGRVLARLSAQTRAEALATDDSELTTLVRPRLETLTAQTADTGALARALSGARSSPAMGKAAQGAGHPRLGGGGDARLRAPAPHARLERAHPTSGLPTNRAGAPSPSHAAGPETARGELGLERLVIRRPELAEAATTPLASPAEDRPLIDAATARGLRTVGEIIHRPERAALTERPRRPANPLVAEESWDTDPPTRDAMPSDLNPPPLKRGGDSQLAALVRHWHAPGDGSPTASHLAGASADGSAAAPAPARWAPAQRERPRVDGGAAGHGPAGHGPAERGPTERGPTAVTESSFPSVEIATRRWHRDAGSDAPVGFDADLTTMADALGRIVTAELQRHGIEVPDE